MDLSQDLEVFEKAVEDFRSDLVELKADIQRRIKQLNSDFVVLDDCVAHHRRQNKSFKELNSILGDLQKCVSRENADSKQVSRLIELEDEVLGFGKDLYQLKDTAPRNKSLFIRLMMGQVNVKMWKPADRQLFKDEYNKFKLRTTVIFFLFSFVQLFFIRSHYVSVFHQVWLVYYYLSLALRENILKLNGSNIKAWWIFHHYFAALIPVSTILGRDEAFAASLFGDMLWFGLGQGVAMLLQHRYQSRRAYTRVAMGKAKTVDPVSTEIIQEKPTDLKILVPLLFFIYAWELYLGICCLNYFMTQSVLLWTDMWSLSIQSLVVGLCYIVLGVGNGMVTSYVLFIKKKNRSKFQNRSKAKREALLSKAKSV